MATIGTAIIKFKDKTDFSLLCCFFKYYTLQTESLELERKDFEYKESQEASQCITIRFSHESLNKIKTLIRDRIKDLISAGGKFSIKYLIEKES